MITNDNKQLAQWAMDEALKQGCQASRVSIYNGSSTSFEVRDMKIDKLQQASENGMSIHLYVDGRYGSVSTNRINKKELEKFIKDNIEATRFLAEDKARTLPDPSLYYKGGEPSLELQDGKFDSIDPDQKVALAMNTCNEVMGKDERIISANSSFSDGKNAHYMVASNGFEGESASTYYSLSAGVSVKGENDARPESYWYDASLFFDTLQKEKIGTKALERTLLKLGQKKIESGTYSMVLDNMNSARIGSPILEALYGSAIQQKNSFLLDKLDKQVLGKNVTLVDRPHQKGRFGSRYFDSEGIATRPMDIVREGVLKTYFIDTYYANKMNVKPTISSPSILTLEGGTKDVNALIKDVDRGIFVTGFNGGNCNSTTGDFSYGVEGFLIEKGVLTQPISEMNVTGNMLTLWNNLVEIGNDPRPTSSTQIPSLHFEAVNFSGL